MTELSNLWKIWSIVTTIHKNTSKYLYNLLENNYYNHIQKIYKLKNKLEIMYLPQISILKIEHFVLLQYYFVYLINRSNSFFVTFFINGFYLNDLVNERLIDEYYNDTTIKKNIIKFKNNSYTLLYYLLTLKLFYVSTMNFYYKFMWSFMLTSYWLLNQINVTYKKRIENIDYDYPRILIITSNKETIYNIIHYTNFFKFQLFIIFLNIFMLFI
jgi:hypothetical protein